MKLTKNTLITLGVFGLGFVAGGLSSYLLTKNAFRAQTQSEVEQVKLYYKQLVDEGYAFEGAQPAEETPAERQEFIDQTEKIIVSQGYDPGNTLTEEESQALAEAIQEQIDEGGPTTIINIAQSPDLLTKDKIAEIGEALARNVFDRGVTLTEAELAQGRPAAHVTVRDPENPYVISLEEFMEDDIFTKISLTYYPGDNTLLHDDSEAPLDDMNVVGQENLNEKFGVGNPNPDTVYVRNEAMNTDFEIFRQQGNYSQIVLDLDPEDDDTAPQYVTESQMKRELRRMRPESDD